MTHAIFAGQATTDKDNQDKKNTSIAFSFLVNVTDPDKMGNRDTFSITVTDSTGHVVYQNTGTVKGHIEIHQTDTDDNGGNKDNDNHK